MSLSYFPTIREWETEGDYALLMRIIVPGE